MPGMPDELAEQKIITCQVCKLAARELARQALDVPRKPRETEDAMSRMVEEVCLGAMSQGGERRPGGEWVRRSDVRVSDDMTTLEVVRRGDSVCGKECLMIQKACLSVVSENVDSLVEVLLDGPGEEAVAEELCGPGGWNPSVCTKALPKLENVMRRSKMDKTSEDLHMEEMMSMMNSIPGGQGVQMLDPLDMMGGFGMDEDYEEDDDDAEERAQATREIYEAMGEHTEQDNKDKGIARSDGLMDDAAAASASPATDEL